MQVTTAVEGFLLSLRASHYSPVTVQNYASVMGQFARHVGPREIEALDSSVYVAYLGTISSGHALSTVQVHWKTLRSFLRWAADLPIPPVNLGPAPKFSNAEVIPLTQDQIKRLLRSAKSRRSRCIILTLLDTGLRASELCRLTVSDVDLTSGSVHVSPFSTGKKSRARTVYLGSLARSELWKFLAQRKASASQPLFSTLRGNHPLDRHDLAHILTRIGKSAGVPGVHPHQFRHTFAIEYLRSGGDVFSLRLLLGHATLEMTRRYLAISQADLATAHSRHSPADRLL